MKINFRVVLFIILSLLVGAVIGALVCTAVMNRPAKLANPSMEAASLPELKEQLAELEGVVVTDLEGIEHGEAAQKYTVLLDGRTRKAKPNGYTVMAESNDESCMIRCCRTQEGHGPFGPGENNTEYNGVCIKNASNESGERANCALEFSVGGFDYRLAKSGDKAGFDSEAAYEQLFEKAQSIIDAAKVGK